MSGMPLLEWPKAAGGRWRNYIGRCSIVDRKVATEKLRRHFCGPRAGNLNNARLFLQPSASFSGGSNISCRLTLSGVR